MKNTVNKQVKPCFNQNFRQCEEWMIIPVLSEKIGGDNGRS